MVGTWEIGGISCQPAYGETISCGLHRESVSLLAGKGAAWSGEQLC